MQRTRIHVSIGVTSMAIIGIVLAHAYAVKAAGSTYYVSISGTDSNNGSSASPFRTIQKAANVVQPGDTVIVTPGTYKERIMVPTSGTSANRIVFEGQAGAIIDGGDSFAGQWQPAPGYPGAYRIAESSIGFHANHITWNDKFFLFVLESQVPLTSEKISYLTQDSANAGWNGIEAVAMNMNGHVYLRLRDGRNPNNEAIRLAPFERGAIHMDGKSFVTIRGFQIKNAYSAIRMTNGSNDNIVENNFLTNGFNTISIKEGSARNQIRNNEITLNYIYSDIGHPYRASAIASNVLLALRAWMPISANVFFENSGPDNRVYGNYIYRTAAAGVYAGSVTKLEDGFDNKSLKIFENRFEYCPDYCIQLHQGPAPYAEVYDNSFYEYLSGIRIGPLKNRGPLYVYRNTFRTEPTTDQSSDLEFSDPVSKGANTVFPTAGAYFYHNSFSGNGWTLSVYGQNMQYSYFINNIFSYGRYYLAQGGCPPGQTSCPFNATYFNYNFVGGPAAAIGSNMGPNNIFAPGVRVWTSNATNFALTASSPARGMGIDLSKPWVANGVTLPALPGMTSGYFAGSAPDAGAVQFGHSSVGGTTPTPTPTPTLSPSSLLTISNVRATVTGPTTATVTWDLNKSATGQVEFGLTTNYGFLSALESRFQFSSHSQNLTGLIPGTTHHYRVKSQDQTGALAMSGDLTFTTQSTSSGTQCSLYASSSPIPQGFASPFNVVNNSNQSMMNASCSTTGQSITLGNGNQTTYIYKTGYVLRNNAWQQVNYTGSSLLYNNWYAGNASGSTNLTAAELTQGTYFLSYQCQWTGSQWKCGCRTAACTGTNGNMWQVQFVRQ